MSRASPTFPSLHLLHSSFSNPSVALPTSQLILQPFRCFMSRAHSPTFPSFTYVTTRCPTLPSLYLRHSSFSNLFPHFTYVTAHSRTLPSRYLRHSSFANPSVASPTSQLILQSFFPFSCVTGFSLTSPGEPLM